MFSIVAKNIERLITEKQLKQCEFAKKAGYTSQQLNDMIKGRKIIKETDILRIANAFGSDVNDLFAKSPICSEEENSDNRILVVDEETNGYKKFFDDVEDLKNGILNVLDERTVKVIIKKRAVRDSSCGESTTNKEAR